MQIKKTTNTSRYAEKIDKYRYILEIWVKSRKISTYIEEEIKRCKKIVRKIVDER